MMVLREEGSSTMGSVSSSDITRFSIRIDGLYAIQQQPLLNGPSRWPFTIVFLADLPISSSRIRSDVRRGFVERLVEVAAIEEFALVDCMESFMANNVSAVTHRRTAWFVGMSTDNVEVGPLDQCLGWYIMRGDDHAPAVSIATGEQKEQCEADNVFHGLEAIAGVPLEIHLNTLRQWQSTGEISPSRSLTGYECNRLFSSTISWETKS
jgi:hypothetical protein